MVPLENHPHNSALVGLVESQSRTLLLFLQHCWYCNYASLWCSFIGVIKDVFLYKPGLQPFIEDGFIHWNIG